MCFVVVCSAMMDVNFSDDPGGSVVPAVDPLAVKRCWNARHHGTRETMQTESVPGAELWAVSARTGSIATMTHLKLLAPWQRGDELDGGVYRVAATIPMRVYRRRMYKRGGDDRFPFDPNAFLKRLIEETGIEYSWEPIPTKLSEGDFSLSTFRLTFKGQEHLKPDPEQEAKRNARDLLWDVWSRYQRFELSPLLDQKDFTHFVALMFGGFVIDNIELARKIFSRSGDGPSPASIIAELERRAQGGKR